MSWNRKGSLPGSKLHQRAREELLADGLPDTEAHRQEYAESLIDYYFANHLTPVEIENYINLARKKDMAQTLSMVVNRDQATAMEMIKALREFCDIPKGRGLYLPGRGRGNPGCPDSAVSFRASFLSSALPKTTSSSGISTVSSSGPS